MNQQNTTFEIKREKEMISERWRIQMNSDEKITGRELKKRTTDEEPMSCETK